MTDEEVVELCRRSYAAWNAGDVDALIAVYHHNEILEIRRAEGDRVLIRGTIAGRSPSFGDVGQYTAQIAEFRDGLVLRVIQTGDPPPGWDEARPLT